ncbi:DUF2851 family protein [Aegicerativicinus sediminis]
MNEDFLYFLWKFQKIELPNLLTTNGLSIQVIHPGYLNLHSGPDFFNAHLVISGQEWAGNVEMHLKSSDWFLHGHQSDPAFENVILHVVWEHDKEIYHKDGSLIPVLELKEKTPKSILQNYLRLQDQKSRWIYCENEFPSVPDFILDNWLQKLFIERLEEKSKMVYCELDRTNGNWEGVLFRILAKAFGTKVNAESFLSIARSLDFKLIQKISHSELQLIAILLGRAGLLAKVDNNSKLVSEFNFLSHKFKLDNFPIIDPKYFRLRPNNFPHLRLMQFAKLYANNSNLFQKLIQTNELSEIIKILRTAGITDSFGEHLIINAIIPVKFCYNEKTNENTDEIIFKWVEQLTIEKNYIIKYFLKLRRFDMNALNSQSLIHLKNNYCDKNQCLQCEIGNYILKT